VLDAWYSRIGSLVVTHTLFFSENVTYIKENKMLTILAVGYFTLPALFPVFVVAKQLLAGDVI
jgi:hypothetical protein